MNKGTDVTQGKRPEHGGGFSSRLHINGKVRIISFNTVGGQTRKTVIEHHNEISPDFLNFIRTVILYGVSQASSYAYAPVVGRPDNVYIVLMNGNAIVGSLNTTAKYEESSITEQSVSYKASYTPSSQITITSLMLYASNGNSFTYPIATYTLSSPLNTKYIEVEWIVGVTNNSQAEALVYQNQSLATATQTTETTSGTSLSSPETTTVYVTPKYLAQVLGQTIVMLQMPLSDVITLLYLYPKSQYSSLPSSIFASFIQSYNSLDLGNVEGIFNVYIFLINSNAITINGNVQTPVAELLTSTFNTPCSVVGFLSSSDNGYASFSTISIDGTQFMFTADYQTLTTSADQFWENCVSVDVTGT